MQETWKRFVYPFIEDKKLRTIFFYSAPLTLLIQQINTKQCVNLIDRAIVDWKIICIFADENNAN